MTARALGTMLRERWWLPTAGLLLGVAAALLVALAVPATYTATETFFVTPAAGGAVSPFEQTHRMASFADLLRSDQVAADASTLLGGSPTAGDIRSSVDVRSDDQSLITLDVARATPDDATLVASAVGTVFTRRVEQMESVVRPTDRPDATVRLLGPPTTPDAPSRPSPAVLGGLGALIGVLVGLGVAFAVGRRDSVVGDPAALGARIGAPVLGAVLAERRAPRRPAVLADVSLEGRAGHAGRRRAQAYRSLRLALKVALGGRRTVAFVGTGPGQRTSTTAWDVAAALAADGERVLLVDGDLRSGTLAERLAVEPSPGFGDLAAGGAAPSAVVRRWATGDLDVVPRGTAVARPESTPGAGAVATALASVGRGYDRVVVDTGSGGGATELAGRADATVVVACRGTRVETVDDTVEALHGAGARVIGAVLTSALDLVEAPIVAVAGRPPG